MKPISIILAILVAASIPANYAISYVGGQRGMPMAIDGFPAGFLPVLLSWICIIGLSIVLILALAKRKGYVTPAFMLVVSLALTVGATSVPGIVPFMVGFRKRIQSQVTPDELRQIAHVAETLIPDHEFLPGPGKWSLWTEDEHRSAWDNLVETTAIDKLDSWLVIFKGDEEIVLSWGGALVGHWGVSIETGFDQHAGDIAEGIQTFAESD